MAPVERPIIFSAPMVRAILEGRKTQTRRVMNPQPYMSVSNPPRVRDASDGDIFICPDFLPTTPNRSFVITERESSGVWHCMGQREFAEKRCPYGIPGDRLWVREAAIITPKRWDDDRTFTHRDTDGDKRWVQYLATSPDREAATGYGLKVSPSIFMPRWASRITLEIASVRVQRVREISEEDAEAEGCEAEVYTERDVADLQIADVSPEIKKLARLLGPGKVPAAARFRDLWNSINAKRGFSWDVNPWVWALTFKRLL